MNSPGPSSTVSVKVEAAGSSAKQFASSSDGDGGAGASPGGGLAELEERMECVKCGDIPVPSYYFVCPEGHTQCGFCAFNLPLKTMTDCCQPENLEAGSEPLLKFVLDNSKWRCKHWDRGCKDVLSYEQWAVHGSKCVYRFLMTPAEEEADRKKEEAKRKAEEEAEENAFWHRDIPVPSKFLESVKSKPQSVQLTKMSDTIRNNNTSKDQSQSSTSVPIKPRFRGRGHGRRMKLDFDRTEKEKPKEKETSVFRVSRNPKPPEEFKCQQKPELEGQRFLSLMNDEVASGLKCYSSGCNAVFESTADLWMHLRDNKTGHALPLIDCSEKMTGSFALELMEWGEDVQKMAILKCCKDVYLFASEQRSDIVHVWVWSLEDNDEEVKGQGESKDEQKNKKTTGYQITLQARTEDGKKLENVKMVMRRHYVPYNLSPEEVIRKRRSCNLSLWELKQKYFAVVDGKPMRNHWSVKVDILPGQD